MRARFEREGKEYMLPFHSQSGAKDESKNQLVQRIYFYSLRKIVTFNETL